MADVFIGTSGYSYKDWMGSVYPEGTSSREFLEYYSREFNLVELNFSYYRQPEADMLHRMVMQTPPQFLFCIKAHQSLTHQRHSPPDENIALFLKGITPLTAAGKLGAVLFQFPYSFHYTEENRKYLDNLLSRFTGIPKVVEFRNRDWQKESVLHGLTARQAGYVNVDEPELKDLPLPTRTVTAEPGYLRFHGRNQAQWWGGDNTSRYDYLYSSAELEEWIPGVKEIIKKAKILLVAFNNHYKGQAIENARQFKGLLSRNRIEVH